MNEILSIIISFVLGVLASIIGTKIIIRLNKKKYSLVFDQSSTGFFELPPDYSKTEEIKGKASLFNVTITIINNGLEDICKKNLVDDNDNQTPIRITLPNSCYINDYHVGRCTSGVKNVDLKKADHNLLELSWEKIKPNKGFELCLKIEAEWGEEYDDKMESNFIKSTVITLPSEDIKLKISSSEKTNEIVEEIKEIEPKILWECFFGIILCTFIFGILFRDRISEFDPIINCHILIKQKNDSTMIIKEYDGVVQGDSFRANNDSIEIKLFEDIIHDPSITYMSISKMGYHHLELSDILKPLLKIALIGALFCSILTIIRFIFRKKTLFD